MEARLIFILSQKPKMGVIFLMLLRICTYLLTNVHLSIAYKRISGSQAVRLALSDLSFQIHISTERLLSLFNRSCRSLERPKFGTRDLSAETSLNHTATETQRRCFRCSRRCRPQSSQTPRTHLHLLHKLRKKSLKSVTHPNAREAGAMQVES